MEDRYLQTILDDYVHADEPQLRLGIDDVSAAIRRSYRMRAVMLGAVGTMATGAVAVTLAVASGGPTGVSHERQGAVVDTPSGVAINDVAYITSAARAAIAQVSDSVVQVQAHSGSRPVFTMLVDLKTGNRLTNFDYDGDGHVNNSDFIRRGTPYSTLLEVNYVAHTWSTMEIGLDEPPDRVMNTPSPAEIGQALRDDTVTVLGNEDVNGTKTIHLRLNSPTAKTKSAIELWVAADTYLPVQEGIGTNLGNGAPGMMLSYTWQPRTAATLAKVDLLPPAGFTEVPGADPALPPPTD